MLTRFNDLNAFESGKSGSIHIGGRAIIAPFISSQEPLTGLRVAFCHRCPTLRLTRNFKLFVRPKSKQ